jgi:hypothetical protein
MLAEVQMAKRRRGAVARLTKTRIPALLIGAAFFWAPAPSRGIEGSSTAGPIGGTDIRSAQLPAPGLYYGTIQIYATADHFFNGSGEPVAALNALEIERFRAGPFLWYVPNIKLLDGSIGFFADVPAGTECGRLFATTPRRCIAGIGDPYVEADWSRYFGTIRKSKYPGALPIAEGLTILLGFGTVFPAGYYNAKDATTQGLVIGNNIWDFAPTAALTYVTKPILAEGTEFSVKLYSDNYLTNPATNYHTGALIDIDFAISEHLGQFQIGLAGYYAFQFEDDTINGVRVPPDGRRGEVLTLGGVLAYDMPKYNTYLKVKGITTIITHNTVHSPGVAFGWGKKF